MLTLRNREPVEKELLDVPGAATRVEIARSLEDIARANILLGGVSIVMVHLSKLIGNSQFRRPVRILDMATGGADIPIAIAKWARSHRIDVQITAVDINSTIVEIAQENTRSFPEIHVVQQDILNLPYRANSFDYIVASQIIHHLSSIEAVHALRTAHLLSTNGVVVSELRRRTLCDAGAAVLAPFIRNRISKHDLRLSFRHAFTPDEFSELAEMAKLPCYSVHSHGPCRMALVSDKRTSVCTPERNGMLYSLAAA